MVPSWLRGLFRTNLFRWFNRNYLTNVNTSPFVRVFVNVAKAKIQTVIKTWMDSRKVIEVQGWRGVYWDNAKNGTRDISVSFL